MRERKLRSGKKWLGGVKHTGAKQGLGVLNVPHFVIKL